MSTLLMILIILTTLLVTALGIAILKNNEDWSIGLVLALVCVGFFGWLLAGCFIEIKTIVSDIPKNKIEILVGKDKIIVSFAEKDSTRTQIFRDAKTFNAVSIDKDSSFLVYYEYNMYNYMIKTYMTKK